MRYLVMKLFNRYINGKYCVNKMNYTDLTNVKNNHAKLIIVSMRYHEYFKH